MDFTEYVRIPFTIEAVEVTENNIEEVATLAGVLRKKKDGTPYVQVDRRLIPNVLNIYPGYWMTRMGDNIRCYPKRVFHSQFKEATPDIQDWVSFMSNPIQEAASVQD